jgi:hypothetical protein
MSDPRIGRPITRAAAGAHAEAGRTVVSDGPLVPGPIYGLRTWRVVTDDGRERLAAPQRGTPWPSGRGWMQAICGEGHAAPASGCQCGIHAWHPRRASARRVLASRFELPGIVEADGAVEVHADGFRAERARPYAFVRLPGRNPFLIDRIAASYGAEILDLRHPKELLAVCRERNLGLQEPVVEALLGIEAIDERRLARVRKRRDNALRVIAALLVTAALGVLGLMVEHTGPQGERDLYGHAGKVHLK